MQTYYMNMYYGSKIRSEKANIAHYEQQIKRLNQQIENLKEKGKPTRSLEDSIVTLKRNIDHSNMMIARYRRFGS